MELLNTTIPGLLLFKTKKFKDERGLFTELYNKDNYYPHIQESFLQDNLSISKFGTLRGLHHQLVYPQGKLVSVLKGAVLDVAVDIRKQSPYYGKWMSVLLTEDNNLQFYIPPGFAHGFLTLTDNTLFHYKCTQTYYKDGDRSIRWNDPTLNIDWEFNKYNILEPTLSEKDKNAPMFEV